MNTVDRFALAATVRNIQDRVRTGRVPHPSDGEMRAWVEWTGQLAQARKRRWIMIGCSVAVVLALLGVGGASVEFYRRPAPIGFTVGSGVGLENHWIRSHDDAPTSLLFSDGSSLELASDARARVVRLSASGAAVTLETGRMHAELASRVGADWSAAAGPFSVHTAGAQFDLEWDAEAELLTLIARDGAVDVTGPLLAEEQRVTAPQRLAVSLPTRQASLSQPQR